MSYHPEPDSHIRDKVKVVLLDLWNYAAKEKVEHATGIDTSDLTAKRDLIALKAEGNKLEINKVINVSISLNNLKTEVNDLDVNWWIKSCSCRLEKIKRFRG